MVREVITPINVPVHVERPTVGGNEVQGPVQFLSPKQEVMLEINADCAVAVGAFDPPRIMIYVDLSNSKTSPGTMVCNQQDKRGFFQDFARVRMWCQNQSREPGYQWRHGPEGFVVKDEDPKGAINAGGSISSDLHYSMNGSTGFFGKGTMTGGAGGGISWGNSYSREVHDFSFSNHSEPDFVNHQLSLTQLADSIPYKMENPLESLSNPSRDPFAGARTHDLPELATSNLPMLTHAHFMPTPGTPFSETPLRLVIEISARFSYVDITRYFNSPNIEGWDSQIVKAVTYIDIDLPTILNA